MAERKNEQVRSRWRPPVSSGDLVVEEDAGHMPVLLAHVHLSSTGHVGPKGEAVSIRGQPTLCGGPRTAN